MAQTAVKDVVIWTKHIHGTDEVRNRLSTLKGGEVVELLVDGWKGPWCRMSDGGDGRPTLGLRPVGQTKEFWQELYRSRRGEMVSVELPLNVEPIPQGAGELGPKKVNAGLGGFRAAAREALLSGLSGFGSGGRKFTRDQMHEREAN